MAADGSLSAMAKDIGGSIATVVKVIVELVKIILSMKEAIITVTGAWVGFKSAILIENIVLGLTNGFKALITTLTATKSVMAGTKVANDALKTSMATTPWGAILSIISLVAGALISFTSTIDDTNQKVIEQGEAAAETSNKLLELSSRYEELSEKNQLSTDEAAEFESVEKDLISTLGSKASALEGLTKGTNEYAEALKNATEEELNEAFKPNTKVMFGETIANPALTVLDIELFAKVAHAHGVPLIVDNTFPTPVNCRPFEWGADIVTHSTTKYMDGHGAALGGAIVDSGNFDWMAHADKYPGLCTPDESYHGITYAEKFGKEGAFITKCTAQLMRDFGSMQSPQNAFILNLGLESLHVRMPKHVENGQAVAEFLEAHPKVAYVNYSGLPSDKYYERAQKYLPNGGCGVVSFGLKGGREAASTFMKTLKLGAIETHVADARTCCLNPATSTHRQMTDEQLKEAGVPAELIRISLGLEDKEDLIADISNALDAI